jgi:UDP-2,3-diacylglucosamine pyrophosphatase LpxH
MQTSWRALWLSDIHLGTSTARTADLLRFLGNVSAEVLYLTGDIIDLQSLKARPMFPPEHREVIARFFELARGGTRVIYIPGNHDVEFRKLAGRTLGGIEVELEMEHRCANGRKMLVMHGDCLDPFMRRGDRLEQLGAAAYQWLVRADARIHRLRNRFGAEHTSISSRIKMGLKSANEYVRRFEEMAARYAQRRGFDGVVCGHIHRPAVRQIAGVCYANDGDWVEHRTALAEAADGRLRLLSGAGESVAIEPTTQPATLAA